MLQPNTTMTAVPHSIEAEEAVLGAIMINPDAMIDIRAILVEDDFYILRHAYIYRAMLSVANRGDVVDIITLRAELVATNRINDIGGAGYLTQLSIHTGSSIHAEVYANLVKRAAVRRRLMQASDKLRMLAVDESTSVEEVEAKSVELLNAVFDKTDNEIASMHDLMSSYYDAVESTVGLPGGITGLPTGLRPYDDLLDGIQPQSLNLIAATTGNGKTSLLMTIALLAARAGKKIFVWSGEMSGKQLRERIVSSETGIHNARLRRGLRESTLSHPSMSQNDWGKFVRSLGLLSDLPIFVDDTPGATPMELSAKVRRLARRVGGLDLIIVDYIGLMNAGIKTQNREREIAHISWQLKLLSKEIAPVYAASQLNRGVSSRQDKRPTLPDLRDSGSLEQDADTVTFIYRQDNAPTELIVAKNRHGATGTIQIHFDPTLTRFTDTAPSALAIQQRAAAARGKAHE